MKKLLLALALMSLLSCAGASDKIKDCYIISKLDEYSIVCSDAVKTCKRVDNKLICTIELTLDSGETQ